MLSEEIRRLRLSEGISQVALAHKLGVSKQSVSNWENNNIQPSIELLERLADVFAVSTDELLGRRRGAYLDLSDLSDAEAAHLRLLAQDLRARNRKN